MAVVKIGSARSDERGKITGGKAGDQKGGKEVSTQNWYKHSKGWRVFRAKDPAKRKRIAQSMDAACDNNKIGYDQWQRNTLYHRAEPYDFDVSKVVSACETDCSALVRVCCAFAGITLPDFNTATEANVLLASGAFTELKGEKYTNSADYLMAGDILVTKTKGHTVVVLTNGSKAGETPEPDKEYQLGDRILKNGMKGEDVKELQSLLIQLAEQTGDDDYLVGSWGADGDFGDATEMAVRYMQKQAKITVDGHAGPNTIKALNMALESFAEDSESGGMVEIVNGNCYVRAEPNTSGVILGTARKGTKLEYRGERSGTGWHAVKFEGKDGWVSGKYSRLVEGG